MFKGSMVAMVTPFKDGEVDEAKIKELVEFHIDNGTDVLVPCGTTGESATLSFSEHEKVVEAVIGAAGGKIPVIAGTGSNNTKEAILLTKHAKKAGADGALVISPYYNKPTQEGLYRHFKAIAEEVDIPIMLYNIASRTAVNIEPETVARLAKLKNIVAVKEASGNLSQMSHILKLCGDKITLISGDDALVLPILAIGGKGVISVIANVVPADLKSLISEFEKGHIEEARKLHYKLLSLIKAMFIETNPVPVKTAMEMMGMISAEIRLPLSPMKDENIEKLKMVLKDYGLI
ncbi:MAG: 4-hydroxy-tetrahydrodipicolinate synthase [Candidatus Omnitrophota bacterium]|nr:4-hydroxy-tetrahydrodipicolinate synthase [Candidatus Omnitrophota bacterium]